MSKHDDLVREFVRDYDGKFSAAAAQAKKSSLEYENPLVIEPISTDALIDSLVNKGKK